jgi:hypothetical protein
MTDLPQLLLTYGPLGLLVLMLIIPVPGAGSPVLVPYWYVMKQQREIDLKEQALSTEREASKRALEELQMANRLVGELRTIAVARAGGNPDVTASRKDP